MPPATKQAPASIEERAAAARKTIAAAQRKAVKIQRDADSIPSASTRTRRALKVKADALDEVGRILAGK